MILYFLLSSEERSWSTNMVGTKPRSLYLFVIYTEPFTYRSTVSEGTSQASAVQKTLVLNLSPTSILLCRYHARKRIYQQTEKIIVCRLYNTF